MKESNWFSITLLGCVLAVGCGGDSNQPPPPSDQPPGDGDSQSGDGDGDDLTPPGGHDASVGDGDTSSGDGDTAGDGDSSGPSDPGFPSTCSMPDSLPDPSARGSFAVGVSTYDAGTIEFPLDSSIPGLPNIPGLPPGFGDSSLTVKVRAEIYYPAQADGRDAMPAGAAFPVMLILHGNHNIYRHGDGTGVSCSDTFTTDEMGKSHLKTLQEIRQSAGNDVVSVPNNLGMTYLAENLASAGTVVALIEGNDVNCVNVSNGFVTERGKLMNRHLEVLRDAAMSKDPALARLSGHLDVQRALYAGHSRGAEAALSAALTPVAGTTLRGVLSVAPSNFVFTGDPLTFSAPLLVVLPAADGDVSFNGGMRYYDVAVPGAGGPGWFKAQQYVYGANHNFFNSVWTEPIQDCNRNVADGDNGQGNGDDRLSRTRQEAYLVSITRTFLSATLGESGGARSALAGIRRIDGLSDVTSVASYTTSSEALQEPQTPESSNLSKIGSYPFSQDDGAYNRTFFHASSGYVAVYAQADASFSLPVAGMPPGASHVAIRVAQVADDAANQDRKSRTLHIALEDQGGHSVSAASDWAGQPILSWYERPDWLDSSNNCQATPVTKTTLGSVIVPISCFSGDAAFDRSHVSKLHISFGDAGGALALTDFQFLTGQ